MTTWRELITEEMQDRGDSWDHVVSVALPVAPTERYHPEPIPSSLDFEFDDGYGASEGCPFTIWTQHYVYFPAVYDGMEWVASVSRDPDGVPTGHVGGQ